MSGGFELRGVSKRHQGERPALDQVSFAVNPGENLALLGPSGCGKSTILRLMAGLEAPSSGEVFINGKIASAGERIVVPPCRRGIAMVFQDLALWPNLTVIDNVLLGLSAQRLSRPEARRRAEDALTLCRIGPLSHRTPSQISGGQQQRVAVARALAARPDYLFLDEPFSGLDLVTKTELLIDILRITEREKITVVLVSHDPWEVTKLCRSAIVLVDGRMEEKGSISSLLAEPRSAILRAFQEHVASAWHARLQ